MQPAFSNFQLHINIMKRTARTKPSAGVGTGASSAGVATSGANPSNVGKCPGQQKVVAAAKVTKVKKGESM